jgi:hypothetical protein
MNHRQRGVRTALGGLALTALLFGFATTASAQGLVITPSLRAIDNNHACTAVNQDLSAPSRNITISILNDATGVVDCSTNFPALAAHASARVTCAGAADPGVVRHCNVSAGSNAIADNMIVSFELEDVNGTALAAVRGIRTVTLFNGATVTPRLHLGVTTSGAECLFVNTGASATFTAQFYLPDGTPFGGPFTVTLGQHQGTSIQNAYVDGVWCEVFGSSATQTRQLRVVLTVVSATSGSSAPVQAQ